MPSRLLSLLIIITHEVAVFPFCICAFSSPPTLHFSHFRKRSRCLEITFSFSSFSRSYLATSSSDLKQKWEDPRFNDSANSSSSSSSSSNSLHNQEGRHKKHRSNKPTPSSSSTSPRSKPLNKRESVVKRLSRAAKEAAEKRRQQQQQQQKQRENENSIDSDQKKDLPDILALSRVIDQEIARQTRHRIQEGETSSLFSPSTSKLQLLQHNERLAEKEQHSSSMTDVDHRHSVHPSSQLQTKCHVALVFSKPLVNNRITVEYATRFQSLLRAIIQDNYQPLVVCICGNNKEPTTSDMASSSLLVSETAAGAAYFQHLCDTFGVDLGPIDLCCIPFRGGTGAMTGASSSISTTIQDMGIIGQIIQQSYIDQWLDQSNIFERKTDEYGLTRQAPRKKVHVHFTLFSTDYQLASWYTIHIRSPRQSPLQALQEMGGKPHTLRGIVQTTWSFQYSMYPYMSSHEDPITRCLGEWYVLSQELLPLLVNLHGVVNNVRFDVCSLLPETKSLCVPESHTFLPISLYNNVLLALAVSWSLYYLCASVLVDDPLPPLT